LDKGCILIKHLKFDPGDTFGETNEIFDVSNVGFCVRPVVLTYTYIKKMDDKEEKQFYK
jgi:hypothetical protein